MTTGTAKTVHADDPLLAKALRKNEEAVAAVEEVVDELGVVYAVVSTEIANVAAEGADGDLSGAVSRTRKFEDKLNETAAKMEEVNQALAKRRRWRTFRRQKSSAPARRVLTASAYFTRTVGRALVGVASAPACQEQFPDAGGCPTIPAAPNHVGQFGGREIVGHMATLLRHIALTVEEAQPGVFSWYLIESDADPTINLEQLGSLDCLALDA